MTIRMIQRMLIDLLLSDGLRHQTDNAPESVPGAAPESIGRRRLPAPQRHEPGDERDEEDLPEQRLDDDERLRQPLRGREVAEAQRRQDDEAEVQVLALVVNPGLPEERGAL